MDNYNINYRLDFCDKDLNRPCRIDILKKGYTGVILSFTGGYEPIIYSYKSEKDNKFSQISTSQATVSLATSDEISLEDFYTGDEKEFVVRLYISGELEWTGFIMPDGAKEPFLTPPYEASLKATDLLATLKTIAYTDSLGQPIKKIDNIKNVILDCLNKTGLNINLVIGVNTYEDTFSKGDNDCPLEQTYIDTNRFIDTNGKAYSCFEILQSLANQFTANFKQVNGAWWFVDIDELRKTSYRIREFSPAGVKTGNRLISNVRRAGLNLPVEPGLKAPLTLSNKDHDKQNIAAYRSVTSYYQFGYLSNDLKNGDLNKTTNTDPLCPFDNWHSMGGLAIGVGEKTEIIDNTNIPKPNGDKYASFQNSDGPGPERVDVNKGMYSDPISILSTNSTRISFGLGSPFPRRDVYTILRVRLTGPDRPTMYYNRDSNSWGEQYRTFGVRVGDTSKTEISGAFQLTPPPYSGFLTLYIHGSFENGGSSVWREYYYNNVSINFDQNSLNKSPIGVVNVCNQLGNYSESPDPVVLLFGDDNERQRTSWMRNASGVPTVSWNGGQQLQRIVAKKILTQYQKTSRLFEGTFRGGASPLDVIQIDLTGGSFFFLSGDFAVKSGDAKLSLAELFIPDLVPINDVPTFFDYGDFKNSKGGNVGSPSGVNIPPFIPVIDEKLFILNQDTYQVDARFNVKKGVFKQELIVPTVAPVDFEAGQAALWIDNLSGITADPGGYVLPIATPSILGGIKVGSGLTIDPVTGVVNVSGGESPLTFVAPLVRTGNSVSIVEDPSHRFVTDVEIANWNAAFGWGNHAAQGYLKTVSWDIVSGRPTNLSQFTNDLGNYGNWITKSQADGWYSLLGHTHVWADITNRPTNLSQFTNDLGNYGNWITKAQADVWYEPVFSVLPISKGGTGSSTRNFVDFGSNESIQGIKTFDNGAVFVKNLIVPTQSPTLTPGQASIWIDNLSGLTIDPSGYILPIATASILGGVKVGSGLLINPTTGVLSVNGDIFDLTNYYTKAQGDARYAFVGGGNASGTWGINITGKSDGAGKLWSTSHPSAYYLFNEWDGTYWQLKSNHPSLVNVGRADSAGNSIAWNGQGYNGAEQSGAITYLLGYDGANWRPTTYTGVVNYLGLNSYMKTFGRQENSVDVNSMLGSGVYGISNSNPSRPNGQAYTSIISAVNVDTGLQIAGGHTFDGLAFRGWSGSGSSFTNWRYVWHSGNLAQDINPTGFTVSQRDANGYIEANFFRSKVSANSVQSSVPSSLYGNAIGNDGYHYSYSSDAVKAFMGLTKGGKFHQYNDVFGIDANTVDWNTSSFTYAVNAPFNGFLGQFGTNYGLQLNGGYTGFGQLAFRNINGDNGTRENWRVVLWDHYSQTAYFDGQSGKSYQQSSLQVGSTNPDLEPTLSFHWHGKVASQMRLGADGTINVVNNPGLDYESLRAYNLYATQNLTAGANLYVSSQAYNSGWYRSNTSGTGWYHELHGGGIMMNDNTYIRTFGNKSFHVQEGHLHVDLTSNLNGIVNTNTYYKTNSRISSVGSYNEYPTNDQIIWTIGTGWADFASYYGLGYEYEKRSSFGHTINFAANAVVAARISLSTGQAWFNGSVTAPYFTGNLDGNAGSATVLQTARTLWGQSFNGSGNVSGALTGVTDITGSGTITMPTVKATAALKIPTVAPTLAPGEAAIWIDNLSGITL